MSDRMEPIRNIVRSLVERELVNRGNAQDAYEIIRRHFAIVQQDRHISNRLIKKANFDLVADADHEAGRCLADKIINDGMVHVEVTAAPEPFAGPSEPGEEFIPGATRRRYTALMLMPVKP